jgi:signal peptide peptidase SppA
LKLPGGRERPPVVAVVRLAGIIGEGRAPFRPGLTLSNLVQQIERAFSMHGVKAVALAINSPGGAPAQSSLIHCRIRALAVEKEIPVIAFAEDVAASGGYWLACAADEIYADESSIVGSLGVISAGFGFPALMKRFGIERRVHASGERKSMLDPFLREDPDDVARLKALQGEVHDAFKRMVRERRAGKLKADEATMFSGEFWAGARALELGLIDGIGEMTQILKERYGDKVRLRPVGLQRSWLRRRFGVGASAASDPGSWIGEVMAALEERALWGRFGL